MKILKKKSNFLKIKNINNGLKHKYKRQYRFLCFKLSIDNKEKLNLYKKQADEEIRAAYEEKLAQLEELKKHREGKEYLLTCYVITYNHKDCIEQCLQSLVNQKTDYPYLIKILDDCSSDGTFEICLDYARKYPEKIELITLERNSGGKMLTIAYENITTKYFCRTDGDDYWCDENKIQVSLDFLEKHPDYVTYAHDTCAHNLVTGLDKSNIHDWEPNTNYDEEISFDNFFYVHVSSRIHRNVLDFKNKLKNTRKRDRILWYLLLDAGRVYYDDRIMAVYTIGKGRYSAMSGYFQDLSRFLICHNMNKYFNYKYDKCFSSQVYDRSLLKFKKIFGIVWGWKIFIFYWSYLQYIRDLFIRICNLLKSSYKQLKSVKRYADDFNDEDLQAIAKARKDMEIFGND